MLQRVVVRFSGFAGLDKCLHSNLNSYLHIALHAFCALFDRCVLVSSLHS